MTEPMEQYNVSQVVKEVLTLKRDKLFDNYLHAVDMIEAWKERKKKDPDIQSIINAIQYQARETSKQLVWYDEAITGLRDMSFTHNAKGLPTEEVVGDYKGAHQYDQ